MKSNGLKEITSPTSSMNKSSKRNRVKLTKCLKQQSQTQRIQDGTHNLCTGENFHEKIHPKNYSGFAPKSIKVFWEQHDTSDTDVVPEAYTHLAEDATYRIWNVINIMKTYSRHSGGRITCDIVNEILRDSDSSTILGLPDKSWGRIEYDGNFFFKTDADVDLRVKYLEEESGVEIHDSGAFKTIWSCSLKNSSILVDFSTDLCAAVFLGEDESYRYACELAATSPYISCVFKILLKKCTEMLIFEQKKQIVARCMRFLCALTFNKNIQSIECREQFFLLANVFATLISRSRENIAKKTETLANYSYLNETNTNYCMSKKYEVLSQKMEKVGIKGQSKIALSDNKCTGKEGIAIEANAEIADLDGYKNDLIFMALGHLSSKFGYFQNQCRLSFLKRLDDCVTRKAVFVEDHKPLSQIIKGLLIVGEKAFRNAVAILQNMHTSNFSFFPSNLMNTGATFLRNREDAALYEWLETQSGDTLQSFILYTHRAAKKMVAKRALSMKPVEFKILPRIFLKCIKYTKANSSNKNITANFLRINMRCKKINFRVTGCRTVEIKCRESIDKFQPASIEHISRKIVIVKRKLFKPLSNQKAKIPLSNFCFTQI